MSQSVESWREFLCCTKCFVFIAVRSNTEYLCLLFHLSAAFMWTVVSHAMMVDLFCKSLEIAGLVYRNGNESACLQYSNIRVRKQWNNILYLRYAFHLCIDCLLLYDPLTDPLNYCCIVVISSAFTFHKRTCSCHRCKGHNIVKQTVMCEHSCIGFYASY